jgi:phosphatidate phosphatase LPIN
MGADAACRAFDDEKISLEKFRAMKQSLISNKKLVVRIAGRYFPWDVVSPVVLGMVSFSEEQVFEHQGMIKVERVEPNATQGGSWRIWPFTFRRTTTMNTIQPICEPICEPVCEPVRQPVCESTVESTSIIPVKELDGERNKPREKRMERKVPSLTPTSEELASLDLREGRNVVTFTFSTAMLGIQQVGFHSSIIALDLLKRTAVSHPPCPFEQVDANIYLWKWNTHIVISDVDGTITK